MTLKSFDKDLRSKYAEALYKNESSYDKEISRRLSRLSQDFQRSSQIIDASSQVFLNQIRQKRNKWIQDDLKYRDHYRLVCRNVHIKKLDNLKQIFDLESVNKISNKEIQVKFQLLQQQLKLNELRQTYPDEQIKQPQQQQQHQPKQSQVEVLYSENTSLSTIPKLPNINSKSHSNGESMANVDAIEKDFNELYSRFSEPDQEFLDKYPAKVELTITELGKSFLNNQKQQSQILKRQKQKYTRIQSNALRDSRFKELVSYLDEE